MPTNDVEKPNIQEADRQQLTAEKGELRRLVVQLRADIMDRDRRILDLEAACKVHSKMMNQRATVEQKIRTAAKENIGVSQATLWAWAKELGVPKDE